MRKAIIFDFDGVIHNTFDFHRAKVKEFTGVALSESEYRDIHNGNFFAHKIDRLKDVDWPAYGGFIYHDISNLKIEGEMEKALLRLSKKFDLFIVSSGGTKNISDYLKNNNVAEIFKEVLGSEPHKSKIDKFKFIFSKYKLDPNDCIFITDTLGDILEANVVNIKTLAVDFGYHGREMLRKGNPFKIVSSLSELLKIIDE